MKSSQIRILFSLFIGLLASTSLYAKKDTTITYCGYGWKKTSEKNAVYYKKTYFLKDGTFGVEKYKISGKPISKGAFRTKKMRVKHGYFVYYDYEGRKQKEGLFQDNEESGSWVYWHSNGSESAKGEYKNGERTGEWRYWTKKGVLTQVSNYKGGEYDGVYTSYVGDVMTEKGVYKSGKKEGEWSGWFHQGTMNYAGTYEDGKKVGEWNCSLNLLFPEVNQK